MSRTPATLSYLAVYNPTLRPADLHSEDDEDAEEQAHILFYTSRERAVSRDKMLRQVGLAKALISFSEQFNAEEPCRNVHSQSRRMVMVSPEPHFWIHAGIEVAKNPRLSIEKEKGKGKSKEREKADTQSKRNGNEEERGKEIAIANDYHESSVHDVAVRASILCGYEQFKLTHGSFTCILSTLGREALELQLERFFTVWAWSWNLDDGLDFGAHLGIPLHPFHRSMTTLLDDFSLLLPEDGAVLFISPPYFVPSTKFTNANYPPALSRHLMSLISLPQPPVIVGESKSPFDDAQSRDGPLKTRVLTNPGPSAPNSTAPSNGLANNLLGIPATNIKKTDKDTRKWAWPGYLTFGKSTARKPPDLPTVGQVPQQKQHRGEDENREEKQHLDSEVDRNALEDAISSQSISVPANNDPPSPAPSTALESGDISVLPGSEKAPVLGTEHPSPLPSKQVSTAPLDNQASPLIDLIFPSLHGQRALSLSPSSLAPEFSSTTVHLADHDDILATRRRKIFYTTRSHSVLVLIGLDDDANLDIHSLAQPALALVDKVHNVTEEGRERATDILPSATKILEPGDRYIISTAQFTVSSPEFASKSEHLYNAQQLLERDSDISEVFSRGQNPQHWHVCRRGLELGIDNNGDSADGEIYLEVSRKETSLTDVENVVSGHVRKFMS